MKRSLFSVAAYLSLVFLSGALVGGLGHWMYTTKSVRAEARPRSPEEYRRKYLREMDTRLKLTSDQLQKLNAILDATRARYRDAYQRHRPELKAIQERQVAEIRAILNETQRGEYELMRREREERKKQRHSGGPGC